MIELLELDLPKLLEQCEKCTIEEEGLDNVEQYCKDCKINETLQKVDPYLVAKLSNLLFFRALLKAGMKLKPDAMPIEDWVALGVIEEYMQRKMSAESAASLMGVLGSLFGGVKKRG